MRGHAHIRRVSQDGNRAQFIVAAYHTRLSILVNPRLGAVDEARVVEVVLAQLGREKDFHRMMAQLWGQAGTLRVRREVPYLTARGKLLPLHILKPR